VFDRAAAAAAAARAVEAGGFPVFRCRMLGAREYRGVWARALGTRRTAGRVG
jgi:hypothetical protein